MTELLREYWDWFLFDTLLWTGALIGLVMLLRRPVARYFGAGAAYALWFLPLARLILPPFTLPSWMQPSAHTSQEFAPVFAFEAETIAQPLTEPGSVAPSTMATSLAPVDFLTPLLLVWLAGTIVFLIRRFWLYFTLRRELLEQARPVGEVGTIRLIETPAISGPMAFGVIDRVIALPEGFMISRDRFQRDLAIEHELSHHRGADLLVNMLVQPLFAMHWFNPLGYLGWTALRRDQEAFCDARVVASRSVEERATYANIIADFARHSPRAPRPALAAPMACPVLGDKSIIHRLRSLSMSDISPGRRLTGRAAIAAAFLAVPLTASICYAETRAAPQPPEPPVAPLAPAEPAAPNAPVPPVAPDVPEPADFDEEFVEIKRDFAERDGTRHRTVRVERTVDDDGRVKETRHVFDGLDSMSAEERAEFERDMAEMRADLAEAERETREAMAEVRREFGENTEVRRQIELAFAEAGENARAVSRVKVRCADGTKRSEFKRKSDGEKMVFCDTVSHATAISALRSAKAAIRADSSITKDMKAEILADLDREIQDFEKR